MHKCTLEQDFPFTDEENMPMQFIESGYCVDDYEDLALQGSNSVKNFEIISVSLEPCRETENNQFNPQGVVCKSPEEQKQFFMGKSIMMLPTTNFITPDIKINSAWSILESRVRFKFGHQIYSELKGYEIYLKIGEVEYQDNLVQMLLSDRTKDFMTI